MSGGAGPALRGAQALHGGGAWCLVALLLAVGALLVRAVGSGADAIDWQPALALREPWRWWSAAWVHWSDRHLFANLAGTVAVAALGWVADMPRRGVLAWLLAWPLTQLGLLLQPEIGHYGGLSGVLHAGVAIGGLQLWRDPARRWIGAALLAGLALKIVLEAPWAGPLRQAPGWDIAIAPLAHATGALAGFVSALLLVPTVGRGERLGAKGMALARRPLSSSAIAPAGPGPQPAAHRLARAGEAEASRALPARPGDGEGEAKPARAPAGGGVAIRGAAMRKEHLDATAIVSLLVCCALWGVNQAAAKEALEIVPPLTQAALRSAGAALLLLAWSAWRGVPLFDRDGSLRGGLLAGALFAGEFAAVFIGLQYTGAARIAVFVYLAPFFVAGGMALIARNERLSAVQLGGLVLAFAGVAHAFAEGFARPALGPHQWFGDALGVLAAALWAATTLAIRGSALAHAPAEKTLLYQLAVSALLLIAAAVLAGERWPAVWPARVIGLMLFQTVIVTFASFLLWFWLVRHYPATRLAVLTLATPIFGLLAGVVLLDEPATPRLVGALVAVTLGIVIVNRRR